MKSDLKDKAIRLRKDGYTYSEILQTVPVAKSTLSYWLHSVGLSKYEQQKLTEKKLVAGRRGGAARKLERVLRMTKIISDGRNEISRIDKKGLMLIGATLYWAEGAKEKSYRTGHKVVFSNSDPRMIIVFLQWIELCLEIPPKRVSFSLYIHQNHKDRINDHINFWKKSIRMKYNTLQRVYFKKSNSLSKRKNIGEDYHGQLRVEISRSIDLNRRIAGLIEGIFLKCPVV